MVESSAHASLSLYILLTQSYCRDEAFEVEFLSPGSYLFLKELGVIAYASVLSLT